MSLSSNAPGRCFHCDSVLVYAAKDCKFICTNTMCKKEQPGVETQRDRNARVSTIAELLATMSGDAKWPDAKGVPSEAEVRAADKSRAGEWFCPNCETHHAADMRCPRSAIASIEARRKFASWPCHLHEGVQCQHHECYQHLDQIPAGPLPSETDKPKVVTGHFPGTPYKVSGELAEELGEVIAKYRGRIGLAETLGVLEILKINLWSKHNG